MNYEAHVYEELYQEFLRELELFDNRSPTWWDELRRLIVKHQLGADDFSAAYRFLIERGESTLYPEPSDHA